MRTVELFCGGGLSAYGLVSAGCELVGACDLNVGAINCFNAQRILPHVAVVSDVNSYKIPNCDLLSGGPVCKAFSSATGGNTKGEDDPRNTFPHFFWALRRARPRHFLIENSFGNKLAYVYLQKIMVYLKRLGYKVVAKEINCFYYGVPQNRKRLVILGDLKRLPSFPEPTRKAGDPIYIKDCLGNLPRGDRWPLFIPLSPQQFAFYVSPLATFKNCYKVQRLDEVSNTILANPGPPNGLVLVNGKVYRKGPRLTARIQGLPDSYSLGTGTLANTMLMIGNGFPPLAAAAMAKVFL